MTIYLSIFGIYLGTVFLARWVNFKLNEQSMFNDNAVYFWIIPIINIVFTVLVGFVVLHTVLKRYKIYKWFIGEE